MPQDIVENFEYEKVSYALSLGIREKKVESQGQIGHNFHASGLRNNQNPYTMVQEQQQN